MRDLVIGASGQVGGALVDFLRELGVDAIGTYSTHNPPHFPLRHLDITDKTKVFSLLNELCPRHVYLSSSFTNVEGCEEDPELSHRVNVLGVENVFAACQQVGSKLIYFSSDYVFDGSTGPYREDSPVSPISVYGRHKVMAEKLVLASADSLVLRTTVVYGQEWQGKNFVIRLVKSLLDGKTIKVPSDQVGNPTFSRNLAEAAALLAECAEGIYNVAGLERVSRYQFAREAAYVFGLEEDLVIPVKTSELGQKAPRPLEGGLVMEKLQAKLPQLEIIGCKKGLQLLHKELERR